MKILFNPEHEEFDKTYALEDVAKEEIIMLIKNKNQTQAFAGIAVFIGYHIGKNILWNRNIGAKFFHYTRFLSFPILFFGVGYILFTKSKRQMAEAGVLDYLFMRKRFLRHTDATRSVMQFRVDQLKTKEDGDEAAVQINDLINRRELAEAGSLNKQ